MIKYDKLIYRHCRYLTWNLNRAMSKNTTNDKPFPFKTTLDLSLLIKYWEANLESNSALGIYPKDDILDKIKRKGSLPCMYRINKNPNKAPLK